MKRLFLFAALAFAGCVGMDEAPADDIAATITEEVQGIPGPGNDPNHCSCSGFSDDCNVSIGASLPCGQACCAGLPPTPKETRDIVREPKWPSH